jgi:metal-responsive CopG/Arc/MetJ family transcriptional regulator
MRTTISIDDQLLKKTKLLAKQANLSLSEFIQACIQKALSTEKPLRDKKFKLITVRGEPRVRKLDLNRTSRILVAEDEEQF